MGRHSASEQPEISEAVPNAPALKEWASVVLALNCGLQDTIYRKGGVQEPDGDFRPAFSAFFLYPAREHQSENFLQTQYSGLVKEAQAGQTGQIIQIISWAEVLEVSKISDVSAIPGVHIYNKVFFEKRLDYKSHIPLLAMRLKLHCLARPFTFIETTEQTGCKSWVNILCPYPPPFPVS